MMENREEESYITLLHRLKTNVENLLAYSCGNTWEVHDGLHRLHVAITDIFKHGFRFLKENGDPDVWVFIQGLSWLQPTLAASPSFLGTASSPVRSPTRNSDKAMSWLSKSIESNTLSEKLSWLLSDQEHLLSCYKSTAYLRQSKYSEATLICLKAVEQRQLSLLARIEPALYLKKKSSHRRSLSYPESKVVDDKKWPSDNESKSAEPSIKPIDEVDLPAQSCEIVPLKVPDEKFVNSAFKASLEEQNIKHFIRQHLLKKYFSCSDLYLLYYKDKYSSSFAQNHAQKTRVRRNSFSQSSFSEDNSNTVNDSELYLDLLKINYDKLEDISSKDTSSPFPLRKNLGSSSSISSSDTIVTNVKSRPKRRKKTSLFKLPFRIWEESDDESYSFDSEDDKTLVSSVINAENRRKSFIESGGNITLPMSIASFAKPSPGQSIMSFLTSGVFTNTYAELDRENAHFHISEAVIAALEQAKFNQQLNVVEDILEESDEEINQLKRIIRIRRRQKHKERHFLHAREMLSPGTSDSTATTDQSVNSLSSSVYSTSESISTDFEEEENDKPSTSANRNSVTLLKSSVSADNLNESEDQSDLSLSAENVAISLLRRFKDNQLPAASEIEWLVSERDAPQQILPLPNSIPVSEDVEECRSDKTMLRGTSEWAPPRPQIIFTPHPSPIRRQLMERQNYRCAGCGTKVAQKYASKFRYCEYLGRYFCTACHAEQVAVIPGRVLTKWDFSKYPVSNFSFRLLDQMFTDPLFNIIDLNPQLYNRARELQKIRILRVSLFYIKEFIFTCKFSDRAQAILKSTESYIYNDPDNYSLADLIQVKNSKMHKILSDVMKICENHVTQCQLCHARGFMCEICSKQEVIFPWQLNTVIRCIKCGSCHHIKCYKQKPICPKCIRISNRNVVNQISGESERVS